MREKKLSNRVQKYYLLRKRKNESIEDAIKRIDQKLIEENFNYLTDRDTFKPEIYNVKS
jgi:hypothetical protein